MKLICFFIIFFDFLQQVLCQYPMINDYWRQITQNTQIESINYTIRLTLNNPLSSRIVDAASTEYSGECDIVFELKRPMCKIFLYVRKLYIEAIEWETLNGTRIEQNPTDNNATQFYFTIRSRCPTEPGLYRFKISYTGLVNLDSQIGVFKRDDALLTNLWPKSASYFFPCFYDDNSIIQLSITVTPSNMQVMSIANITQEVICGQKKLVQFEPTPKIPIFMMFMAVYKIHNNTRKTFGPWPSKVKSKLDTFNRIIESMTELQPLNYPIKFINVQHSQISQWFPFSVIPVSLVETDTEVDSWQKMKLILRTIVQVFISQNTYITRYAKTQIIRIMSENIAKKYNLVNRNVEMQYRLWKSIFPSKREDSQLFAWPIRVNDYSQMELNEGQVVKGALSLKRYISKWELSQVRVFPNLTYFDWVNFTDMEKDWLFQPNHPVVIVEKPKEDRNKYSLSYNRFVLALPSKPPGLNTSPLGSFVWGFPVTHITNNDPESPKYYQMDRKYKHYVCSLSRVKGSLFPAYPHIWMMLNPGHSGYYRVQYTKGAWEDLRDNFYDLTPINQATILDDVFNLAKAGDVSYNIALMFIEVAINIQNGLPLTVLATEISFFERILSKEVAENVVNRLNELVEFIPTINQDCYNECGIDNCFEECLVYWLDIERSKSLCQMQITQHLNESAAFLYSWLNGHETLNPQIRELAILYGLQGTNSDAEQLWGFMYKEVLDLESSVKKEILVRGLVMINKPSIVTHLLDAFLSFDKAEYLLEIVEQMATFPFGRDMIWNNLTMLTENTSLPFIEKLLQIVVTIVQNDDHQNKVLEIIDEKFNYEKLNYKFKQLKHTMEFNIEWKQNYETIINSWALGEEPTPINMSSSIAGKEQLICSILLLLYVLSFSLNKY